MGRYFIGESTINKVFLSTVLDILENVKAKDDEKLRMMEGAVAMYDRLMDETISAGEDKHERA